MNMKQSCRTGATRNCTCGPLVLLSSHPRQPRSTVQYQRLVSFHQRVWPSQCLAGQRQLAAAVDDNSPLFKPFVPQTKLADELRQFKMEVSRHDGTVVIQCLTGDHIPDTAALLTEAFSEAMGFVPLYRRFLCRNIEQYLLSHMTLIPKTVILVAILYQNGACLPRKLHSAESSTTDLDFPTSGHEQKIGTASHHSKGVVVGTLELSFTTSTRTRFMTLNAPPDCAYLCNMAVSRAYQRQGFGKLLLEASERVVKLVDEKRIFLHLRCGVIEVLGWPRAQF
eukprot:jgi/Botrbrau1/553/Bobra.0010s0027.4